MNEHDEILIKLRDELYDGSWDKFLEDLFDKRKKLLYVKHRTEIDQDIARIKEIR
jgi:hypothetical protein